MTVLRGVTPGSLFMGKLGHGTDLLEEITQVCREYDIKLGRVEALGAVQKARVGYYDQQKQEYQYVTLDHHLEITHLVGNISLKDGEIMVHAHITLADDSGKAFGGHLATGTVVFAGEFILQALEGERFERELDSETGLPLWAMES